MSQLWGCEGGFENNVYLMNLVVVDNENLAIL